MIYLEYIGLLAFALFRKVFGLAWFFIAVPFREYARNVVYNYVLSNGIYLKRLLERPITIEADYYIIGPFHNSSGGCIQRRKVSRLEYQLVYWLLWGWLDDDANDDTFDMDRVRELRKESPMWAFFLQGAYRNQYGNAFDLGDFRLPNFHFFASMFWNVRNTAYNFRYMQYQKETQPFLFTIFGYKFGWDLCEDGKDYELTYFSR